MIRTAIIGTGMVANFAHIPALKNRADVYTIVGVCDKNEKSAADTASRHGIDYHTTDAASLIADTKPDLVTICVPNRFHAPYIRMALEAGANVICEKPMALTYAEAVELFALAESKGKLLTACQSMRFTPDRLEAKEMIAAGALGEINYGEFARIRRRGIPKWGAFHIDALNGGGCFVDIGVHMLDALVWLMGETEVVSVTGTKSAHIAHKKSQLASGLREAGALTGATLSDKVYSEEEFDVEDFASGSILFAGGKRVNFKVAWAANLPDETSIILAGDEAGIKLPDYTFWGGFAGRQADISPKLTRTNPYPKEEFGGHFQLYDHLTDVLSGSCECMIRAEETIAVSAIIDLFYRSCAEGREISFSELQK
ncbi:MAG: Gfo/Idh/MocA family oxidoreductase [Ruminococcaceae bacterium]|nr:Gfo/Idh/MocA family oxidoreductase [Oscillospiraceae bacterium]